MTQIGTPQFSAHRTAVNSQPAVELVVRNSTYDQALHDLVVRLGYQPTPDIANRRAIICTTPAEVDAAREPLKHFFRSDGSWAGKEREKP